MRLRNGDNFIVRRNKYHIKEGVGHTFEELVEVILLFLLLLFLSIMCFGCSVSEIQYGQGNVEKDKYNYCLTRITELPDDWTETDYWCYYYHVDTKVVYFGSNSLSSYGTIITKLESEEFDKYIYDEENNKFIGVK